MGHQTWMSTGPPSYVVQTGVAGVTMNARSDPDIGEVKLGVDTIDTFFHGKPADLQIAFFWDILRTWWFVDDTLRQERRSPILANFLIEVGQDPDRGELLIQMFKGRHGRWWRSVFWVGPADDGESAGPSLTLTTETVFKCLKDFGVLEGMAVTFNYWGCGVRVVSEKPLRSDRLKKEFIGKLDNIITRLVAMSHAEYAHPPGERVTGRGAVEIWLKWVSRCKEEYEKSIDPSRKSSESATTGLKATGT